MALLPMEDVARGARCKHEYSAWGIAPSFRVFCAFVCDAHLRAFVRRSVGASRFASIYISREDRVYAKPPEACREFSPAAWVRVRAAFGDG
eukprot:scaffold54888_cov54-Phaeocystis_antarctica.AAC.1